MTLNNKELEKEIENLKQRVEHQDKMIEIILAGNIKHAMDIMKVLK